MLLLVDLAQISTQLFKTNPARMLTKCSEQQKPRPVLCLMSSFLAVVLLFLFAALMMLGACQVLLGAPLVLLLAGLVFLASWVLLWCSC